LDLAEFFPPFFGGTGQLPSMLCMNQTVLVMVPQLGAILQLDTALGTAGTIALPDVGTAPGGKSKFAQYGRKLFPLNKDLAAYRMTAGMSPGEVVVALLDLRLCVADHPPHAPTHPRTESERDVERDGREHGESMERDMRATFTQPPKTGSLLWAFLHSWHMNVSSEIRVSAR